jgi:UDP-N-acetylglucosamine 2-epimerase (non-hydrolysing)
VRRGVAALADVRIVVGTRPQVIKLASLVKAFASHKIDFSVVHTGQHYDFEMDQVFFEELKLPKPETHLGVGSGSHAGMTGAMLMKLEDALRGSRLVVVPGDTNSALAGALAAVKMGIEVGHVEAGLRSHLPYMPEEINRVLVDHMSRMLFAPTKAGKDNLLREDVDKEIVHLTGDVMADNIVMLRDRIGRTDTGMDLDRKGYVYVTVHRAENVDDPKSLRTVADMLAQFPDQHGHEVVFPMHPHTRKNLEAAGLMDRLSSAPGLHIVRPVSYLTSLRLATDAKLVMTDSGGLQKEAFLLGTPAVTLRGVTEWVETTEAGWNIVTGLDPVKVKGAVEVLLHSEPRKVDPLKFYGNGKASENIAKLVEKRLA